MSGEVDDVKPRRGIAPPDARRLSTAHRPDAHRVAETLTWRAFEFMIARQLIEGCQERMVHRVLRLPRPDTLQRYW